MTLTQCKSEAPARRALAAVVAVTGIIWTGFAQAALTWDWAYTGAGVDASGTMTTTDMSNSGGYFEITGITGLRNGDAIVSL